MGQRFQLPFPHSSIQDSKIGRQYKRYYYPHKFLHRQYICEYYKVYIIRFKYFIKSQIILLTFHQVSIQYYKLKTYQNHFPILLKKYHIRYTKIFLHSIRDPHFILTFPLINMQVNKIRFPPKIVLTTHYKYRYRILYNFK